MIGTTLGPYRILEKLGAGGMGEVYAARDTRLDRTVAIKVLPESLAGDPIFRERFEREARSLSALSHPNICTVHDVGQHGGFSFLVMERLEGQTLAAVLESGPMPAAEALQVAAQIADALIAAHRRGIVHRDLKPANVMIGRARGQGASTTAKLLDFGLAKETAGSPVGAATADQTRAALTSEGTLLGTFQYMPPEQIEGREVDARTDIWAFGCVLYEMFAGRRAFDAPTNAGVIAAVLERRAVPLDLPDAALAGSLNRLIDACLAKDPDDRFQSMRDVRRELGWVSQPLMTAPIARPAPRSLWPVIGAALVAAAVVGGAAFALRSGESPSDVVPPAMFEIGLGEPGYTAGPAGIFGGAGAGTPVVAPDGRRIAFVAHKGALSAIWVRDLSALEPRQIRGTSGARGVFWSPDGRSLGFFADAKLKALDLESGRIENICDAPIAFGGTWGPDGTILFSPDERSALYRVKATGGTPAAVTTLDPSKEQAHRWPQFLADGQHFIYMPWRDGTTVRPITLGSLDGSAPRMLFEAQSGAVPAGNHILFVGDQPARLMAWPFDEQTMTMRGQAFQLVADENVDYEWFTGEPNTSAAGATLAYTSGKYRASQLTWVGRTGRPLGTIGEPGVYFDPVVSRDGLRLALEKTDPGRGSGDIWTVDLERGAFSRVTSAPGFETTPIWSPDGRVAYAADQGSAPAIYMNSAAGADAETRLIQAPTRSFPLDWSADGRYVALMLNGGTTGNDIWTYDAQSKQVSALVASPFNEGWARISPDGRWMAYVTDESQQREVYVRSFPSGAAKVQISTAGGGQPQWRRDGRELFYVAPDNTIMSVAVSATADRFDATKPEALFTANIDQNKSIRNQYAVAPDGQRFLVLSIVERNASPIVAVLNWRRLIRR